MPTMRTLDAITVLAAGSNLAVGAASANVAVPNNSSGRKARYVRVYATSDCYIRQGLTGVTAAAGDTLIGAGGAGATVLHVLGSTHIAAIQLSAGGTLNIVPLED